MDVTARAKTKAYRGGLIMLRHLVEDVVHGSLLFFFSSWCSILDDPRVKWEVDLG